MKLAIIGGGGFRVPLVFRAVLQDAPFVDEVVLHDTSPQRLDVMRAVLGQLVGPGRADATVRVTTTTDPDDALRGADFVFAAIRVGGLAGRVSDERVALAIGVLGQETTGPGGIAYGLRTVPVAVDLAERIKQNAPTAFVINFTNPAGMITEAMQRVLGPRVIGICDTPSGLGARIARLCGVPAAEVQLDYVGLNHLGWMRRVLHRGVDLLPGLLAEDDALAGLDEAHAFGADWLRAQQLVPNEYLYYYYRTRDAITAITAADRTRGEFLQAQQADFYRGAGHDPARALQLWQAAQAEREATYLAEARGDDERLDLSGGGYERVATAVMSAIARNERAGLIVNVANGATLPQLPPDAVIEVPCSVDANGAHPLATAAPALDQLGLMLQLKAVERLTIDAALTGDPDLAVQAFALHPLVDSITVARDLLARYRAASPDLLG